jgi:uncharacterized membrane protein
MRRSKSSLDLDENFVGLLCYLFLWVTGIVFLILEKKSRYVRFHAIQSILTFLSLTLIGYGINTISGMPIIGGLTGSVLSPLFCLMGLLLWVFLMFKAFIGEKYKIPVIGDIAQRYSRFR